MAPPTVLMAKHPRKKAAKWAAAKRPRKSRPSDINRKPREYSIEVRDGVVIAGAFSYPACTTCYWIGNETF